MEAFAAAVAESNRLNNAQLAAVLQGEDFPLEAELAAASAAREQAKYAILHHQQAHGC